MKWKCGTVTVQIFVGRLASNWLSEHQRKGFFSRFKRLCVCPDSGPLCLCVASCRNGERTAPHAHQGWAGAAIQPNEHHTTGYEKEKDAFIKWRRSIILSYCSWILDEIANRLCTLIDALKLGKVFQNIDHLCYCDGGGASLLSLVCLLQQSRPIQSRFLQSRNLNCIALCEGNNTQRVSYAEKTIRSEGRRICQYHSTLNAQYLKS